MPTTLRADGRSDPTAPEARPIRYSIATLVNRPDMYAGMVASFRAKGFDADCEYLAAEQPLCAYAELNRLLKAARGTYVILCHQDVRLLEDGRDALDARLAQLDGHAPEWALAGNAGGIAPGRLAMRISDPHGRDRRIGDLPARVWSLDENFIVVRRATPVGFSRDLSGFHLYGADICLVADLLGHSAWVIDFHLEHLSPGRKDASFTAAEAAFRRKWSHALRPRWLQTTCTLLHLADGPLNRLAGPRVERVAAGLLRRVGPARREWASRGASEGS